MRARDFVTWETDPWGLGSFRVVDSGAEEFVENSTLEDAIEIEAKSGTPVADAFAKMAESDLVRGYDFVRDEFEMVHHKDIPALMLSGTYTHLDCDLLRLLSENSEWSSGADCEGAVGIAWKHMDEFPARNSS